MDQSTNLDEKAGQTVNQGVEQAKQTGQNVANRADQATNIDERAGQAVEDAQKAARNPGETARDVVETVDQSTNLDERAGQAAQDVQNAARNPGETARDVARQADQATRIDEQAQRAAQETVNAVQDPGKTAQNVVETVDQSTTLDEKVGQTTQNVADTATNVAADAGSTAANTADHAAGSADEATGRAVEAAQQGDAMGVIDETMGSVDEEFAKANVNTEVTDDLTKSGGLLSETPEGNSGLLPGQVAGVNLSEQGLQHAAQDINQYKQTIETDEGGVPNSQEGIPEQALEGAEKAGIGLLNLPQHATTVETTAETAQNAPEAIQEHGAAAVGETAMGVAGVAGASMARDAINNPAEFAGGAAFEYLAGAGIGKVIREAGPTGKIGSRVRTADRTELSDSMARESVEHGDRNYPSFSEKADGGISDETWTELQDPESFPAQPSQDPVQEIKNLANEFTPKELQQNAPDDATVMKHVTPEGDFVSQDRIDVEGGDDYDTEGLYTGPDLFTDIKGVTSQNNGPSLVDRVKAEVTPQRPTLPTPKGVDVNLRNVGSEDPVVDVADPAVGTFQVSEIERMPEGISSKEEANRFLEQQGQEGTAYVRNTERIHSEAEAIVPKDTAWMKVGDDFRTDVRGTKLKVNEFAPVDQGVIEDVTGETGQDAIDAFEDQAGTEVTTDVPPVDQSVIEDMTGKEGQDAIDAFQEQTGTDVTTDVPDGYRPDTSEGTPYAPTPGLGDAGGGAGGAQGGTTDEQQPGPAETGGVDLFGAYGRRIDEFGFDDTDTSPTGRGRDRGGGSTNRGGGGSGQSDHGDDVGGGPRDRGHGRDRGQSSDDGRTLYPDTGRRDGQGRDQGDRDRRGDRNRDRRDRDPGDRGRPGDRRRGRPGDRGRPDDPGRPRFPDRPRDGGRDRDRRNRDRRRDRDRMRTPDPDRQRRRRDDEKREEEEWWRDQVTSSIDPYDVGFRNPIASGASVLFGGGFPSPSFDPGAAPEAQTGVGGAPETDFTLGGAPKAAFDVGGAPEADFGTGAAPEAGLADYGTIDLGPAPESGALPSWWDEARKGEW